MHRPKKLSPMKTYPIHPFTEEKNLNLTQNFQKKTLSKSELIAIKRKKMAQNKKEPPNMNVFATFSGSQEYVLKNTSPTHKIINKKLCAPSILPSIAATFNSRATSENTLKNSGSSSIILDHKKNLPLQKKIQNPILLKSSKTHPDLKKLSLKQKTLEKNDLCGWETD